MDLADVREHLDQECEFPADRETLVARVGDVVIEAPEDGAETIRTVLERTEETSYRSIDDAYNTILGNVGDAYIGRKYYDDRGRAESDGPERSV